MLGTMRQSGLVILVVSAIALAACKKESSEEGASEGESGTQSAEADSKQAGRRIAKQFQVKSGVVEYALSGMRSGTEVLYWDDWGERQSRCTKASISMMGMTQTSDDCVISLPDVVYTIDMKTKTAMKSNNPGKAFADGLSDEELEEFGRRMNESMGMKKVGTDTVAGHSCDLWRADQMQTETCTHKGIPLRTMTKTMGTAMTITATKVDLDADVDDSRFTLPADVTVQEAADLPPGLLDAMKGSMGQPQNGE